VIISHNVNHAVRQMHSGRPRHGKTLTGELL